MTLSVIFYPYHFVRAILSIPFCPILCCPCTILSIPFCPLPFCPRPGPGPVPAADGYYPGRNREPWTLGVSIGPEYFTDLDYADDVVLLAESCSDVDESSESMSQEAS